MSMADNSAAFEEQFLALPEMLQPAIPMHEINQVLTIYSGKFRLVMETGAVEIDGSIYLSWTPQPGIRFKGTGGYYSPDMFVTALEIDGLVIRHGNTLITHIGGSDNEIRGRINNPMVLFETTGKADAFTFELPNFTDILGLPVRTERRWYAGRVTLEDEEWRIELDQLPEFDRIKKELKEFGGYGLNYTGRVTNKKRKFNYEDSLKMVGHLGLFFSFLNGRRCFPCQIRATDSQTVAWTDYSTFHADAYKEENSWLPQMYTPDLNELWVNFIGMVQDPNDYECLDFLVHWYLEANNNSGFAEGAIVFLQNAFELLFNWQVVEKAGLMTAKQAFKIPAADKLRTLLQRTDIPSAIPQKYQKTVSDLQKLGINVADYPELFNKVRNTIVHANDSKRKTLKQVPSLVRFHIRQLGLCYLELMILHILGYKGKYANRASENMFRGGNEETVPWAI